MTDDDLIKRLSRQADRIDSCGQRYSLSAHLMRRAAAALHEADERLGNMGDVAMAKQVRIIEMGAELEALNLEVMAHQVGEGYEKGYEHGSLTAAKFKAERDVLAAQLKRAREWMLCPEHGPDCDLLDNCCCTDRHLDADEVDAMLAAALEADPVPEPRPGADDQTVAEALRGVAHAAWHLMDDSGELSNDDMEGFHGDFVHLKLDHDRLSDALDALEAAGWEAHPDA